MIFKLVWENVRSHPVRTLLSILLIAVPVTLILTLIGLSRGFLDDSAKRQNGIGADIVFRAKDSSVMGTFSGCALPQSVVGRLAQEPHIALATGVVNQSVGGFDTATGIDVPAFNRMSGGFTFEQGHTFAKPDDILLDSYYAQQRHVRAGDSINVLNRQWHIAGVVEPGILSHIFLPLAVLQDLTGCTGKVSQVYLKVDHPANLETAIAQLKNKYVDFPIYSMRDIISLMSVQNIPLLAGFINAVIGIGVVIGFAVVSLSMYMAVLQRTREIGILKSLGASKGFVLGMILAEAGILGLGGTLFGILLSFGTRYAMQHLMPASLPQAIVPLWWPIAGGIAMGAALLGALYPGMLAVKQDPIEALAYE
jgi:putative ABC transport system permease protein